MTTVVEIEPALLDIASDDRVLDAFARVLAAERKIRAAYAAARSSTDDLNPAAYNAMRQQRDYLIRLARDAQQVATRELGERVARLAQDIAHAEETKS